MGLYLRVLYRCIRSRPFRRLSVEDIRAIWRYAWSAPDEDIRAELRRMREAPRAGAR